MIKLLAFANYNGRLVLSKNLPITQTGVGAFTTIKVKESTPLFLENHLMRLAQGSGYFSIDINFEDLKNSVKSVIEENQKQKCAIRIAVLKDYFTIHSYIIPSSNPVNLITVTDTRIIKNIKIVDRTINESVLMEAKKKGAGDGIFVQDGNLIEATRANIFSVDKNGTIITPPIKTNGLLGITRQVIMESIYVAEKNIRVNTTAAIILTNSLRIQQAISLNKNRLDDGTNLFKKLQSVLEKKEDEYIWMHT